MPNPARRFLMARAFRRTTCSYRSVVSGSTQAQPSHPIGAFSH